MGSTQFNYIHRSFQTPVTAKQSVGLIFLGLCQYKDHFPKYRDSSSKDDTLVRQSHNRNSCAGKTSLYIEMLPCPTITDIICFLHLSHCKHCLPISDGCNSSIVIEKTLNMPL